VYRQAVPRQHRLLGGNRSPRGWSRLRVLSSCLQAFGFQRPIRKVIRMVRLGRDRSDLRDRVLMSSKPVIVDLLGRVVRAAPPGVTGVRDRGVSCLPNRRGQANIDDNPAISTRYKIKAIRHASSEARSSSESSGQPKAHCSGSLRYIWRVAHSQLTRADPVETGSALVLPRSEAATGRSTRSGVIEHQALRHLTSPPRERNPPVPSGSWLAWLRTHV